MRALAFILIAVVFGSGLTIQLFLFPQLIARVQDRSAVTRVANEVLRRHHTLAILLIAAAMTLLVIRAEIIACVVTGLLLLLNLYQRFWVFTKLHVVKQPIGVQDLIQPDNLLRQEFNRLNRTLYLLFKIHLLLLLVDLCTFLVGARL